MLCTDAALSQTQSFDALSQTQSFDTVDGDDDALTLLHGAAAGDSPVASRTRSGAAAAAAGALTLSLSCKFCAESCLVGETGDFNCANCAVLIIRDSRDHDHSGLVNDGEDLLCEDCFAAAGAPTLSLSL